MAAASAVAACAAASRAGYLFALHGEPSAAIWPAALALAAALALTGALVRELFAASLAAEKARCDARRDSERNASDLHVAQATLRVAALAHSNDAKRIRLYCHIVDAMPVGVAILRIDDLDDLATWRVVESNPAGRRLAAVENEAGRPLFELAPELADTDFPQACREASRSGQARRAADVVGRRRLPGKRFAVTILPIGAPFAAVLFEDVTAQDDLRRAHEELERRSAALSRSNAELTQFAYVASHDLQSPLRKAVAFAEQLCARLAGKLDETDADFAARLRRSLEGMQALIDDLLKLARVASSPAAHEPVDMTALAREVAAEQLESGGGGAEVNVDALPEVDADPRQMRQLLQNLIGNALKFRHPDRPSRVHVSGRGLDGERCELIVEDDGVGFDMRYIGRLFQPFQRLHSRNDFPGTGIGLAICQKIVERHGGTISAESVLGRGTAFRVIMPRCSARTSAGPVLEAAK